jgi:arsenate reductase
VSAPAEADVLHRLSLLDRFLPAWIGAAMVLGIALGRLVPDLNDWLDEVKIGTVSLPIAVGLLVMMYPVLAKVKFSRIGEAVADRRAMAVAMTFNWLIGPAVMFSLAWLLLPDLPEYRTGLIIVGLAPCIAMVLIWNDLAHGDRELVAVLVAIDALIQIVTYSVLGWFYLETLPGWLGLDTAELDVTMWEIAKVVLVFLGVPLVAGFLTRTIGERRKGVEWYEQKFLPRLGPLALYGLLFTVVLLFALQGETITDEPWHVLRIAIPLLAFFAIMWFGAFFLGLRIGFPYARNTAIAFTAASNNFELAIAVAIGVFGVTSGEALAGVVGPLIEVPVLVGLVYVALWAGRKFYRTDTHRPEVLFVCIHNAGRSQMAAALLAHHGGDRVVVRSAGTAPSDGINPAVVEVMAEVGIDLHAAGAHPKRLDDAAVQTSDVVITMGCGDECPFYPGKRYLDWALPDPAGQGVEEVRPIRDEIDLRVQALLKELLGPEE